MYSGSIKGVGPRYCPSIEDKIKKFADKQRHQIFEPEGLNDYTISSNGYLLRCQKIFSKKYVVKSMV